MLTSAVVNKVRHEFRQIFFEMGFEEMPTNRYVCLVNRWTAADYEKLC